MTVYAPVSTCAKNVVHLSGHVRHTIFNVMSGGQFASCRFSLRPGYSGRSYARLSISKASSFPSVINLNASRSCCLGSGFSKQRGNFKSLTFKGLVGDKGRMKRHINVSMNCEKLRMRLSASKQGLFSKIKGNVGSISLSQGCTSTGLIFGLMVCNSSSEPTHAEVSVDKTDEEDDCDMPYVKFSHGKKVYTDYSITGIPGDGRCLFRSVAHGACLRVGKPAPSESLQRELADDLRARVADEFIKRRQETEWFVEGDFDTYVEQIRKPHVWGGEPELFMASHVLKMPISVYMHDKNAGGLISIAEYGQEYGKQNPIRVLYHGFGHYDALQIPAKKGGKSKL